jgi:hypothetical protein
LAANLGGGGGPFLHQGGQHHDRGQTGREAGGVTGQELGGDHWREGLGNRPQLVVVDAPGQADHPPGLGGEPAPQPQAGQVERGTDGGLEDAGDGLVGAQLLGRARPGLGQLVGAKRRRLGLRKRLDLDVLVGINRVAVHRPARRRRGFH